MKKLEIYQVSEKLADEVWEMALNWNHLAQDTVGKQLIRAADSIGANIAERSGRDSDKDFLRLLEVHYTKHDIGFVERSKESLLLISKLK